MKYILTNYGHRFTSQLTKSKVRKFAEQQKEYAVLLAIYDNLWINEIPENIKNQLTKNALIKQVNENIEDSEIQLKYKRNPLEHIQSIVFEMTTECNFACSHCRNGFVERVTETDFENLKAAADAFIRLGVRRFDFIGGEVSKYAGGWLQLAKHIQKYKKKTQIRLFTNAWWIGETNFEAAGISYKNQTEYLADLKENGITHIIISIDGSEKHHDAQRHHKGLFSRIRSNIENIQKAGIKVRISTIIGDNYDKEFTKDLVRIFEKIYTIKDNSSLVLKKLSTDEDNIFSSFIDIGSGLTSRKGKYKIEELDTQKLHCKAFYRPFPNLRIQANGNISVCPLLDSGEGYGNIRDNNILTILNNFEDNFAYKLHSEKRLKDYLKYYDKEIFGDTYDHLCSVRAVLTCIAKDIETAENPNISEIIRQAALKSGYKV